MRSRIDSDLASDCGLQKIVRHAFDLPIIYRNGAKAELEYAKQTSALCTTSK
jgi:hypothetical protein